MVFLIVSECVAGNSLAQATTTCSQTFIYSISWTLKKALANFSETSNFFFYNFNVVLHSEECIVNMEYRKKTKNSDTLLFHQRVSIHRCKSQIPLVLTWLWNIENGHICPLCLTALWISLVNTKHAMEKFWNWSQVALCSDNRQDMKIVRVSKPKHTVVLGLFVSSAQAQHMLDAESNNH
jgi:hypothetical protein